MITTQRAPGRTTEDLMSTSRSVLLSHLNTETTPKKPEEVSKEEAKSAHKAKNMLTKFLTNRPWPWIKNYLKYRFTPRHVFVTYNTDGSNTGVYKMVSENSSGNKSANEITIALASDWGTDTPESMLIGLAMDAHKPDYSIHMGDTYYVGLSEEIEQNFMPGNSYWPYGSIGSFALPGNHEMYSNGNAYFHTLLPWMGIKIPQRIPQQASYMCLETEYWRIIGLDTGHKSVGIPILEYFLSKANLPKKLLKWLEDVVKIGEDNKGLIFLTHHQYVSAFSQPFPATGKQLAKIIGKNRKVLWLWGHEHRFAMYGRYATKSGPQAYGRCIGHGGMPQVCLKKFNPQKAMKNNLVLYDNRTRITLDNEDVGHNGFALLKLQNENLTIEYYDEKQMLVSENWKYNSKTHEIMGIDIKINNQELNLNKQESCAIK
ncbi:MAG: metallophosphoesterase [Saprospiraceae bacterium]